MIANTSDQATVAQCGKGIYCAMRFCASAKVSLFSIVNSSEVSACLLSAGGMARLHQPVMTDVRHRR